MTTPTQTATTWTNPQKPPDTQHYEEKMQNPFKNFRQQFKLNPIALIALATQLAAWILTLVAQGYSNKGWFTSHPSPNVKCEFGLKTVCCSDGQVCGSYRQLGKSFLHTTRTVLAFQIMSVIILSMSLFFTIAIAVGFRVRRFYYYASFGATGISALFLVIAAAAFIGVVDTEMDNFTIGTAWVLIVVAIGLYLVTIGLLGYSFMKAEKAVAKAKAQAKETPKEVEAAETTPGGNMNSRCAW